MGSLYGLTAMRNQVEQRARHGAIDTAAVVATLTVHRNVSAADFVAAGGLTTTEKSDLDGDVATLLAEHRVVGLEVWRSDGQNLYADPGHPVAESKLPEIERARITKDEPWIVVGATDRSIATWEVFLPYDAGIDGVADGLIEVLIPDTSIGQAVAATSRQLYALTISVLIVSGLGVMTLRRRLVRREHEASHDRLTGLVNWGGFRDAVQASIRTQMSKSNTSDAVLLIDLDGFKSVNDTLGHPAGDTLLQQVGNLIRSNIRARDVVARMGGDEFAVLLTGLKDPLVATDLATDLLARLQDASFEVAGICLGIEASIGIALIPADEANIDVLLSQVDIAMYSAKRTGAGVAIYDNTLDRHDLRDLTLLGELRRAIDNDELILHYQPKADVISHRVTGVEALVRWNHPTRGRLAPDHFIPLAESTGLLGPLTHWVLSQAISEAAQWRRGGFQIPVAVNVSPRSLLDGNLTATIIDLLAVHDLPSHLLEIEVTETAIMTDPDASANVLRQLRAQGVRTSIDDFGSGYTSLAHLTNLPVDALKIDRIFISDLTTDDRGSAVVKSIIDLGHRLGLSVLAEGVENAETWRQLELLECDELQGYLLARPMRAEHIEDWITAHERAPRSALCEVKLPRYIPPHGCITRRSPVAP